MAIQLGSAYGKVSIDSSGVTTGVGIAKAKMMELADLGMKVGDKLQGIGTKLTLGLTLPIIAFGAMAVKEAAQTEAVIADLNAVIASTKGVAGVTEKSVKDYAGKMQLLTKFSDDQIIAGNAMLLTFTRIGKGVFPQASDATLDLAQKFGMDLSQASIMLGKALNDPVAGVGALRRIGVQLSAAQEKQIKDFMAINDIASAQKIILGELKTEVGGVAEAYGKTFSGQLAIFNHRLDDIKEKIGVQLIPALIRLMDSAQPLLDWFSNASPATIDFIIKLAGIAAVAGPVTSAIGTIIKVFSFFSAGGGGGMAISWISSTLIPALTGTSVAAGGVAVAFGTIILPIIVIIGTLVLLYLAFKNNFMGITDTVKQAWFLLGYYINQLVEKIKTMFSKINWPAVGKFMLQGLANGMLGGIPMIVSAAMRAGQEALATIKRALGISSPSKEFMKLGVFSGQGFSAGLANAIDPNLIARTMAKPVQNMSSNNSTTTIHLANGLTLRDVDQMMNAKINNFANRAVGAF